MKAFLLLIKIAFSNHSIFHKSDLLPDQINTESCGVDGFERIVGGQSAKPHSWPWIVRFLMNGRHSCGGSISV